MQTAHKAVNNMPGVLYTVPGKLDLVCKWKTCHVGFGAHDQVTEQLSSEHHVISLVYCSPCFDIFSALNNRSKHSCTDSSESIQSNRL